MVEALVALVDAAVVEALVALVDAAVVEALVALVDAALVDAALADALSLDAAADELDACWPQPASANISASANATTIIESSLVCLFIRSLPFRLPFCLLHTNGP